MRKFRIHNQRGQAAAEMALFGSLLLLIFGSLLAYLQRANDQQYVQMQAFRQALYRGCTYSAGEGAGGSAQYTVIENRRQSDLSGGFRKGSAQTFSGSANVYWAVPEVGGQAEGVNVYKINEDEIEVDYAGLAPEGEGLAFQSEDLVTTSSTSFNETTTKEETPQGITNTSVSGLQETITTTLPYTIRQTDAEGNPENGAVVSEGAVLSVTQGLYLDSDGQYKYSSQAVGNVVERGKKWETGF